MTNGTAGVAGLLFELNGKHAAHPFGIYQGTWHAKTGDVSHTLQIAAFPEGALILCFSVERGVE